MKVHPAADVFPMLDEVALQSLSDDIREHGLTHPIVLFEGAILDGRNRSRACQLAKVEPRYEEYTGGDPIAYVVSANLKRRHLNESQRAMVGARIMVFYEKAAKERQRAGVVADLPQGLTTDTVKSRERAGADVNVSGRIIQNAAKVLGRGTPELVAAVHSGIVAVDSAAKIVDRPAEEQRAILEKVKAGDAKNIPQAQRRVDQEKRSAIVVPKQPGVALRRGDARELTRAMTERPHVFITDPPYGIETHNTRRGGKDYADGPDYALSLFREVLVELEPKLADDAHGYVFAGYDGVDPFRRLLAEFFDVQRNPIIWIKDNHVMCDFAQWYPSKHEYVIHVKKRGRSARSRPLAACVPDTIECARTRFTTHSAEKPPGLIRTFIEQSSVPGELIFDPFMGGGATKVAAVASGRAFLGFELEKEWFDVARTRTE